MFCPLLLSVNAVKQNLYLFCIADQPAFNGGSVETRAEGDEIHISWATPSGFFTAVTLMQCLDSGDDNDDSTCIHHNVTSVTTLAVRRSDGTVLTLIVWQDRDDVLSYRVNEDEHNPGNKDSGAALLNHFIANIFSSILAILQIVCFKF